MIAIFIINFVGSMYGTLWALYGEDRFSWSGLMIGLSLGAFDFCHALAQAFVTGPAVQLLGERWALIVGMACEMLALAVLGFATQGWIVMALAPLFALGGVGMPALQSLITTQVGADKQGQLQGVLASLVSLAEVFGPLFFSTVYFALRGSWPG